MRYNSVLIFGFLPYCFSCNYFKLGLIWSHNPSILQSALLHPRLPVTTRTIQSLYTVTRLGVFVK